MTAADRHAFPVSREEHLKRQRQGKTMMLRTLKNEKKATCAHDSCHRHPTLRGT